MRSSIFLSDLTVVDHAFINEDGAVVGGSYNPGFIVTGEVSDDESVVVDFSTVKKDLKNSIDSHIYNIDDNGFDHKLWIIEGYSNCKLREDDDRIEVITPAFIGSFPSDAIRFIQNPQQVSVSDDFIGQCFAEHTTKQLSKIHPDSNINVECFNTTNWHLINRHLPIKPFRYSHGLKNSTSYGCQNLAHGHLSFIQHADEDKCNEVAHHLHNAVFINNENIIHEDAGELTIEYNSQRGYFRGTYNKKNHKIIILPTETTIEYIAEYVSQLFNISGFYISEGLSKGTIIE